MGSRLATNSRELIRAIGGCSTAFGSGVGLFIDSYEDGPEVDIKFVLQDGEILISSVADSFPTTAEQCLPRGGKSFYFYLPEGDFLTTNLVWPSKLPQKEQDLARDTMFRILLELGARDGVFYTRARIRNSSVHYSGSGCLLDLVPRPTPPDEEPSVLAMEARPQPPHFSHTWREKVVHGVDYYVLQILCALYEWERFRALVQPYGFWDGSVPFWLDCAFIIARAGLVYRALPLDYNVMRVVERERPDLAGNFIYIYYDRGLHDNL